MVDPILPSSPQPKSGDVQNVSIIFNDSLILEQIQSDYLQNYVNALSAFVFASGKNDEFDSELNAIQNSLMSSQDLVAVQKDISVFVDSLNQELGVGIPLPSQSGSSVEEFQRNIFNNYAKLGEEFYSFVANNGLFSSGLPQGIDFSNLRIDATTSTSDMEKLVGDLNTWIQKINAALIGEDMGKAAGDLFPEFEVVLMPNSMAANFSRLLPMGIAMNDDTFMIDDTSDSALTALAKAFAAQKQVDTDQKLQESVNNQNRNQNIKELRKEATEAIANQLQMYTDFINKQVMDQTDQIQNREAQRVHQIHNRVENQTEKVHERAEQKIDQIVQRMSDNPDFQQRGEAQIHQIRQQERDQIQKLNDEAKQSIQNIRQEATSRIQQVRENGDRLISAMSRTLATLTLIFITQTDHVNEMSADQATRTQFATIAMDQGISGQRVKLATLDDPEDQQKVVMGLDQINVNEIIDVSDSRHKTVDFLDRPVFVDSPTFMNLVDRPTIAESKKGHDSGENAQMIESQRLSDSGIAQDQKEVSSRNGVEDQSLNTQMDRSDREVENQPQRLFEDQDQSIDLRDLQDDSLK